MVENRLVSHSQNWGVGQSNTQSMWSQASWHIPVIPPCGRLKQENGVFETSLHEGQASIENP